MRSIRVSMLAMAALLGAGQVWAQTTTLADVALPAPRTEGGKPLMQSLRDRQSTRDFSDRELSSQVLSDLLWAAAGINRPHSGKRTAPSARNWQEVEVYVVLASGAFRYDAKANRLVAVAQGDLRSLTGGQEFVAKAPLNLIYVADTTKVTGVAAGEEQWLYLGADTGFISQNVYLFCASEGLATVVRGSVDRPPLARALGLSDQQRIILAQSVGYPAVTPR